MTPNRKDGGAMSTDATRVPTAPGTKPVGNGALRLATLMRSAEVERGARLGPVWEAFDAAQTEEEIAAAAGEVVAQVTIANSEYERRIERAIRHLGTKIEVDL
jgi:hypothetical protein